MPETSAALGDGRVVVVGLEVAMSKDPDAVFAFLSCDLDSKLAGDLDVEVGSWLLDLDFMMLPVGL